MLWFLVILHPFFFGRCEQYRHGSRIDVSRRVLTEAAAMATSQGSRPVDVPEKRFPTSSARHTKKWHPAKIGPKLVVSSSTPPRNGGLTFKIPAKKRRFKFHTATNSHQPWIPGRLSEGPWGWPVTHQPNSRATPSQKNVYLKKKEEKKIQNPVVNHCFPKSLQVKTE